MLCYEMIIENAGEMYLDLIMKRRGETLEDLEYKSPEELKRYGIHSEQLKFVVFVLCRVINEKVLVGFKKRDDRIVLLEEKVKILTLEVQNVERRVDGLDDEPVMIVDHGEVDDCQDDINKLRDRVVALEEWKREKGLG